ncbi:HAD family hydrolase [Candidatus Bathyarchaeota archaeon]|nr:HAD family hydrolase [Candidatus Bathyarchaeota archaeon]
MKVEAVLFDLFDTLLLLENDEIYYEPCLKRMHSFLAKNGVNVSFAGFSRTYFEVRDTFYSESRKSLEEPHFNVRVSQTLQKLGFDFDVSDPIVMGATKAFADEFMRYVKLDDGAIDVLQKLHGKYKLGLVSNFGIPECGRELLDRFNLTTYLDFIVISGEVNQRKPNPKIFRRALQALGVAPSKAVFVGDMLDLDIMGPKSVGMRTILIKRRPIEGNSGIKPDKVIEDLTELLTTVEDC